MDQGLANGDEFRESNCDDCKHGSCNDDYKSAKLYADSNTICKYRNEDTRRTCAGNTTGKITSDICDNGSDRGSHQGSKRKNLKIHSPSHVFRRMGNNTMDSYGMGVKDRAESVKSSVMESLNFSDINGKIDTKAGRAGIKEQNIFGIQYWKE